MNPPCLLTSVSWLLAPTHVILVYTEPFLLTTTRANLLLGKITSFVVTIVATARIFGIPTVYFVLDMTIGGGFAQFIVWLWRKMTARIVQFAKNKEIKKKIQPRVSMDSDKKRQRDEDEFGFGSPAAKIAAKLGADITMEMGESLEFINERLARCKTLKDFKSAA